MNNLADSDKELIEGLVNRLMIKDKAIHDLTVVTKKLETLNNKLLNSEKTKSDFLSNIKNEVNNPLASIMGLSKIISSSEGLLNSDIISMGNAIYKEAFNLDFQMENIFAAAEIEAGEAALSVSNVDIKSLMQNIIDSFNHWACEKKLKIALNLIDYIKKDDSFFKTDPKRLQLIVSNLLANAIEYSFEDGQVDVKVWKNRDSLNISVKDNGIGIDEKDQRIIFDRFKQLDAGTTKRHRGHGLGLSIVKEIVELLNGKVSVDSKKGGGAVFTVSIHEQNPEGEVGNFSDDGNDFFFEGDKQAEKF